MPANSGAICQSYRKLCKLIVHYTFNIGPLRTSYDSTQIHHGHLAYYKTIMQYSFCAVLPSVMYHTIKCAQKQPHTHNGKEFFSSPINSSISKLNNNQNTTAQTLTGLLLLRLVCEVCQISTSTWESIGCHWLSCISSYHGANHYTTGLSYTVTS